MGIRVPYPWHLREVHIQTIHRSVYFEKIETPHGLCNNPQVDPTDRLFELCSYMINCANFFFRLIREHGVWLRGRVCTEARTAGHEMNVARHDYLPEPSKKYFFVCLGFLNFWAIIYFFETHMMHAYASMHTYIG